MTTASPTAESPPANERARLATLGIGAAWILGIGAALQLLAIVLGSSSLAEAIVGALIADVAAGRAGVAWSVEEATRPVLIQRAWKGAAIAAGVLTVTLVAAAALGWHTRFGGRVDGYLLMSVGAVIAMTIRDELLYRALPIHFATRAKVPQLAAMVFAAALSPTAWLLDAATPASIVLSIASGFLFASIYVHFRGAWASIAAHATYSLILGPLTHGGFADLHWLRGELVEGPRAGGPAPWFTAVLAVAAALFVVPRVAPAAPKVEAPAPAAPPPEAASSKDTADDGAEEDGGDDDDEGAEETEAPKDG